MASAHLFDKYETLIDIVQSYGNVAVAFSGGIDSSLLLYAAAQALGRENVVALHGSSCLNNNEPQVKKLYNDFFKRRVQLKVIELQPLLWENFVGNDEKRCYYCKKKAYTEFVAYLKKQKRDYLLDGTNIDDLQDDRPGLLVLEELGVKTPLVEAGLTKEEIRVLGRSLGLPNHDLASNSCLATRLKYMPTITAESLQLVASLEEQLMKRGFLHCRVRLKQKDLIIEVRQQDFQKFAQIHNRLQLQRLCERLGFKNIYLDISGR